MPLSIRYFGCRHLSVHPLGSLRVIFHWLPKGSSTGFLRVIFHWLSLVLPQVPKWCRAWCFHSSRGVREALGADHLVDLCICVDDCGLQERYRRERHIFTPMREEIAHRSNHESKILEPVK